MSNPHPHGQIYATNFVYKTIESHLNAAAEHHKNTNKVLFADILKAEETDARRIIAENETMLAFVPYFARFAYEVIIAPKRTVPHITSLSDAESADLARILHSVVIRMDNLWSMSFPYLMMLHQAPVDDDDYSLFHFHIELYPSLRTQELRNFSRLPMEQQWAAYIAGVLTVLMTECSVRFDQTLVLYLHSTVPVGKGVSSSAAIEVTTMRALTQLIGLKLDGHRQAVLCQKVENTVVGAPCGLMDQMTSSLGKSGCLLNLLCQPDILGESLRLPDNLAVWGIDSGVRHEVSGSDYTSVRVAAFMGYRLMLQQAEIAGADLPAGDIVDGRWNGYLANVSVSEFTQHFLPHLPQSLTGSDFLAEFDDTTDRVTTVDPERQYAVLPCTAHPVHEHFRVSIFAQLLKQCDGMRASDETAKLMGECLLQSHASYNACGLGSQGTDKLVARLRQAGSENGVYGARITGGGSGGTVAVLANSGADDVVTSIAADYAKASGIGGQVFSGSSAGACVYADVELPV